MTVRARLEAALAFVLIALVPLPSPRAVLRVDFPTALNPVNVLLAAGLLLVARRIRVRTGLGLAVALLATLHLALLAIAWMRTQPDSFAIVGNWLVVPLVGLVAVLLLPVERRAAWLGAAFAVALAVVGLSVFAEALGLYDPPVPELAGPLAVKPNGGIMLQANEAGALVATFAVPAALLLERTSKAAAGALLVLSLAVVLTTHSRESVIVFLVAAAAAAVAAGRIRRPLRALLAVAAAVSVWAIAFPAVFARARTDPNYFLRGRPALWDKAVEYLRLDQHWLVGGGLDGFETYARGTSLGNPFTTHNEALRLLVDGGVPLLAAYGALAAAIVLVIRRAVAPAGLALAAALGSFLAIGLVKDFGFFSRPAAWLWALVALAAQHRVGTGSRP